MKKLLTVILGLVLIVLSGCDKTQDTVKIATDIKKYTPLMSSARGITMTPVFESENSYKKLEYHWVTEKGEFIGIGKEVKNQGEAVIWSAIEEDKVVDIKNPFKVKLEIIDSDSEDVLADTSIEIYYEDFFYQVKREGDR